MFEHYRRGLGTALRHNQVAYAYSVTITSLFGVVEAEHGAPAVGQCYLFVVGAGVGFAVVNAAITKWFSERLPREPSEVVALGTALSIFSMSGALGLGTLVAWLAPPWVAWGVAPLLTSIGFIASAGVEMGVAQYVHEAGGSVD